MLRIVGRANVAIKRERDSLSRVLSEYVLLGVNYRVGHARFLCLGEAQAAGAGKPFATLACDGFRTSERQGLDKGRLRQLQGRVL
jgi:hypothetical protein